MSCGVGHRCGLDLALLRLWCRPTAIAPIRPLAWEPPYAMGAALEKAKIQKQNKTKPINEYNLKGLGITILHSCNLCTITVHQPYFNSK